MSSPSASKRGLCWPVDNDTRTHDSVHTFTRPGSRISWLYNWSPAPTPDSTSLEFVPMQWNHVDIENLAAKVEAVKAHAVLGFNEPERSDQANITPAVAAELWLKWFEPLRKAGVKCGSPGISSAPEGLRWLQEFMDRVKRGGGDVDFYCLHWYGEGLGGFYDYLWSTYFQLPDHEDAESKGEGTKGSRRKGVWVTEFAATNWNPASPLAREDVENFAREASKYLDSLEWVEKYAWFGPMRDTGTVGKWARMLDDDGKLTELGRAYRDV